MGRAVAAFLKAPEPGRCKTRLCPPLTFPSAAEVYRSFCRDVAATIQTLDADRWWVYDPSPSFPSPTWAADFPFLPQEGKGLGERLIHAFDTLFARGNAPVVIIGTDAPLLTKERLEEAFTALKTKEAVFGPALDGGYYLVGLTRPRPALFQNIPWSTEKVLTTTRAILARDHVTSAFLPPESDVDTMTDLRRLWTDLQHTAADRGTHTRAALSALQPPLPR
jgi:rSAM/selenodomain-associated transferase 1